MAGRFWQKAELNKPILYPNKKAAHRAAFLRKPYN